MPHGSEVDLDNEGLDISGGYNLRSRDEIQAWSQ
jgi:hypothetical protein